MLESVSQAACAPPDEATPPGPAADWVRAVLDEIDYPMLLVDERQHLKLANRAGRLLLASKLAVSLAGGQLTASDPSQDAALAAAVRDAAQRGLRRWLRLQRLDATTTTLAVVPTTAQSHGQGAVALVFARSAVCQALSIDSFARACGLTPSETLVLHALSDGATPRSIADRRGVALSTVRTQLGALRAKTGVADLRSMVHELARLPPMMHVAPELWSR